MDLIKVLYQLKVGKSFFKKNIEVLAPSPVCNYLIIEGYFFEIISSNNTVVKAVPSGLHNKKSDFKKIREALANKWS